MGAGRDTASKLSKSLALMIDDFKTYTKALEPGGSISDRAKKVQKLLVYEKDPTTPRFAQSADDDGEEDEHPVAVAKALDALRAALLQK